MKHRTGFTLVELLVVIGIISVLLSILLPALGKARESGRAVQCLSNLKQISYATMQYCNDNQGYYPGRAGQGAERGERPDQNPEDYSGWIAWKRKVDPVTGGNNPSAWDHNITYSALARYMGVKAPVKHGSPREANLVNTSLDSVFRCPSDNVWKRVAFSADNNGGRGLYRYSYSMNVLFGNKRYDPASPTTLHFNPYRKFTQVRRASGKIIYMDESEQSVNNGEYNPLVIQLDDPNKDFSAIAERHENKSKKNSDKARGNVAFADGHAELFSRLDAFNPHCFDPGMK